jgi:hypothetical protein
MVDTVRVEGVPRLRAALGGLGADVQNNRPVNADVSVYIATIASQRAPRRTGRLALSVRPAADREAATITFGVPYANAVHWGTGARAGVRGPHNIRRNPFAWNAAQDTETTWVGWYADRLEQLTDKAMEAAS